MNSRLLISQSKKAGAMIINPIPVMVGGQNFPFVSGQATKHEEVHRKKITVMRITSRRSFFGDDDVLVPLSFAIEVKPYLRLKKGNAYTSCLFLA